MITTPQNLPLLIGDDEYRNKIIETILKRDTSIESQENNLIDLSTAWRIKVWFKNPTRIKTGKYFKIVDSYTLGTVFKSRTDLLCYSVRRKALSGFPLNINNIEKYEPIISSDTEFENFDEFKRKFDTRFITKEQIESLWNTRSSQHGKKYNKQDFRKIGPRGKKTMKRFLNNFSSIYGETGPQYTKSPHGNYQIYTERYHSSHHAGRDISISHQTNSPSIYYSSEYHGCGNGRYGLIVNKNTFLWLEDD